MEVPPKEACVLKLLFQESFCLDALINSYSLRFNSRLGSWWSRQLFWWIVGFQWGQIALESSKRSVKKGGPRQGCTRHHLACQLCDKGRGQGPKLVG